MAASTVVNPARIAYFEAHGWRAYYERRWLTLLSLIIQLCQTQFHIPFPVSLQAAYYVTRASIAWQPVQNDKAKARLFYTRFYALAKRYSRLRYDPAQVGALELDYNEVHRRLSGQPDKAEFIATMTALHSALFGLTAAEARESAEWRVQANTTVDRISSGQSTDPAADWLTLEAELRCCYESIERAVRAKATTV